MPDDECRDAPNASVRPDPRLAAEGWERRFLADPERAREAVELYASLGFEVRLETLRPADFDDRCGDCPAPICRQYVMIYTRGRPSRKK